MTPPAPRRATLPPEADVWPDPGQCLLLQAALGQGEAARTAWADWRSRHGVDQIDPASYGVLPAVAANPALAGTPGRDWRRVRGIYRHTWVANELRLRTAAEVTRTFRKASITPLFIKGAPLAALHYGDLGARALRDLDVVVHDHHARQALACLLDMGFGPEHVVPPPPILARTRAIDLRHPRLGGVDLHVRPFALDTPAVEEAGLWARSQPFPLADGVEGRCPGVTDLLLLTLFHSRRGDLATVCRWVVDAEHLCRNPIDWPLLIRTARALGWEGLIAPPLAYLRGWLGERIPDAVLARIHPSPGPSIWAFDHLPSVRARGILGVVRHLHARFRARSGVPGRREGPLGFPVYLLHVAAWFLRRHPIVDLPAHVRRAFWPEPAARQQANAPPPPTRR